MPAFVDLRVPAVQVDGGLVVTASGWRLLTRGTLDPARRATGEREADRGPA